MKELESQLTTEASEQLAKQIEKELAEAGNLSPEEARAAIERNTTKEKDAE